ncbi:cytochrome P450 [Collybia nuda]|uniref:Cytochrome P450 n=1 Tax=Collybia nuda TaxID=64659 RepID=A0A9P5Y300_9AGAR|nr:cytochrome P450 [Collybia nuda]
MLFYKWGKIYGDIIHLRFLHRDVIVLNSTKAAVDLLDKRSANYSDRPEFPVYKLMGWVAAMPFIGYGKRFQQHSQLMQPYLAKNKVEDFRPILIRESRVLLQNLNADEKRRDDFVRRFSTAIVLRITYGQNITTDDDPFVKITLEAGRTMANGGPPGSTPVDFFPFLKHLPSWFPGCYYAAFARKNRFAIDALINYPFDQVVRQMAEGKAGPSFLSYQLEKLQRESGNHPDMVDEIKGVAGAIFFGGSGPTWATLSIFFLAIILHPESQRRAQEEIDAVIGSDRLPDFSDRESLPFIECILQETLRWNPAVPFGIIHRSLEDDVYNGMFISKGSLIIPNARGMTLDESVYTEPSTFNPARYLPKPQGNGEPHLIGPFGFGRRICPGRYLANDTVWIAIASVLAVFDIRKSVNRDGKEVTPEVEFTSGINYQPLPFEASIKPRHERARRLIVQEIEDA